MVRMRSLNIIAGACGNIDIGAAYNCDDPIVAGVDNRLILMDKEIFDDAVVTFDVTITQADTFYVLGVLDDGEAVSESDETNNVSASSGVIDVTAVPQPPTIGWLTVSPDPAETGAALTVTAHNVTDPDSAS